MVSDRKIVSYVVYEMTPLSLATWTSAALGIIENWPAQRPYLALHDLSYKAVIMNYLMLVENNILNIAGQPSAYSQVERIIGTKSEFHAQVAVNILTTFSGNLGRVFAEIVMRGERSPKIEYEVFHSRPKALRWLPPNHLVSQVRKQT
jgi:hypothetical protein